MSVDIIKRVSNVKYTSKTLSLIVKYDSYFLCVGQKSIKKPSVINDINPPSLFDGVKKKLTNIIHCECLCLCV